MVKITVSADCGNSPKKLFLKDLHIAFAKGDIAFISDSLDEDVRWQIVGDRDIHGKVDFLKVLQQTLSNKIAELTIKMIITHGTEAAVNGERLLENGEKYAFCDVYTFRNAKGDTIKSITSYRIEITSSPDIVAAEYHTDAAR